MSKVITANILATGVVVFLGSGRRWVQSLAEALLYADEAAAASDLARAKQDHDRAVVVDPFVTDVTTSEDGSPTMSLRDRIRAYGPTINFLPADQSGA